MEPRAVLLAALHDCPSDEIAWLALADILEEEGQDGPAKVLRSLRQIRRMRQGQKRRTIEQGMMELLAAGVRPVVPELTNSIGMRLALVPPGSFRMGSPPSEHRRMADEQLHRVQITRPFYLGVFQVTQDEYHAVTRRRPSYFRSGRVKGEVTPGRFPVENISWTQAAEFCERLSRRATEKAAGRSYRLPTEAEWEYACRGGISNYFPFHFGPTLEAGQANFDCRYPYPPDEDAPLNSLRQLVLDRPCEVGQYPPNAFGLYDMHGNVDEWCADYYDDGYYEDSPVVDPPGPEEGYSRVLRGGSWRGQGEDQRAAVRIGYATDQNFWQVGFRVACDVAK